MTRRAPRQQRRRTWRRDPEGRRVRILEAAAREFAQRGLREARLDRIATAADVAEGTVYQHFGSKQGLLVAVGEEYGRGMARAAFAGLGPDPAPEQAERVVRNIFGHVRQTEGALATFLLAQDPLEGGPAQDANREQMLAAIRERIRMWIERGQVPAMDARVASEIQFGLVESALRDCFLRRGGEDEALYIQEVSRCLAAYLGASSPGA